MFFPKALYTFSIALLVLAFVVFGVAAIPTPEPPSVPPELQSVEEEPTEEQQELIAEQREKQQAFEDRISLYNQVVSFVSIGVAVALLAASILWLRRIVIIGDAVALGAVFTLLYGLYYALSMSAGVLTLGVILLGLVSLMALVYWRFVHLKDEPGWIPAHEKQATPEREERGSAAIAGRRGTAS